MQVLRVDLNTSDNRWFEHMRDELQKVTQSPLDANIYMYVYLCVCVHVCVCCV
jgi:hypothetical protein